jgi:succinate dehydrogenase/fumarate reductase flavoprotein subunit
MPGHAFLGQHELIGTTGRDYESPGKEATRRNIQLLNDTLVTDILIKDGQAAGVTAIDLRNGDFLVIKAKCTILATGGGMEVYQNNCGSREVTGDGYSMAYRAGCPGDGIRLTFTIMVWPKVLCQQIALRLRLPMLSSLTFGGAV